jgi:hypothetical protein
LRIKEQETHLILHEHDDDHDDDYDSDEAMRFLNPNWCRVRGFVGTLSVLSWGINWALKQKEIS